MQTIGRSEKEKRRDLMIGQMIKQEREKQNLTQMQLSELAFGDDVGWSNSTCNSLDVDPIEIIKQRKNNLRALMMKELLIKNGFEDYEQLMTEIKGE